MRPFATLLCVAALGAQSLAAQAPAPGTEKPAPATEKAASPAATGDWADVDKPVVTKHSIRAGGRALNYTVTTGMMPIRSNTGELEARMFFMAYTLDAQ